MLQLFYDINVKEATYSVLVTPIQVHNATSQTSTLKIETKACTSCSTGRSLKATRHQQLLVRVPSEFRFSSILRKRAAAPFFQLLQQPAHNSQKHQPGDKKHKAAARARLQTLAISTLTIPSSSSYAVLPHVTLHALKLAQATNPQHSQSPHPKHESAAHALRTPSYSRLSAAQPYARTQLSPLVAVLTQMALRRRL